MAYLSACEPLRTLPEPASRLKQSWQPLKGPRDAPANRRRPSCPLVVSKDHVYELSREGRIPVVKLGRRYRYHPAAIEAFERGA